MSIKQIKSYINEIKITEEIIGVKLKWHQKIILVLCYYGYDKNILK